MYPAHPAHFKNCFPNFTGGRKKIKKSHSHIYPKGGLRPPETPCLQGARRGERNRQDVPPAACSLEYPQLLRVNPYSRRQAAVNQIISNPHGRKPVGQQKTYLTYMTCTIGEGC